MLKAAEKQEVERYNNQEEGTVNNQTEQLAASEKEDEFVQVSQNPEEENDASACSKVAQSQAQTSTQEEEEELTYTSAPQKSNNGWAGNFMKQAQNLIFPEYSEQGSQEPSQRQDLS